MKKLCCLIIVITLVFNVFSENTSQDIFDLIKSYNQATTIKKKAILDQIIGKKYLISGNVIDADYDKDGYYINISLVKKIRSDVDYYYGKEEDQKIKAEQEYLSNMFTVKVYLPKSKVVNLDIGEDIKIDAVIFKVDNQKGKIIFFFK